MAKTTNINLNLTTDETTNFGAWRRTIDGQNETSAKSNMQIIDEEIGSLKTRLNSTSATVNTQSVQIENIKKDYLLSSTFNSTIPTIQNSISTTNTNLANEISAREQAVSDLQTSVNTQISGINKTLGDKANTTTVTQLQGAVSGLSNTVSGHGTSISNLTTSLQTANTNIGNLQNTTSSLTTNLSSLTNTVGGHTTSINTVTNTANTNKTNLSNLTKTVNDNKSYVDEELDKKATITALNDEISARQTAITNAISNNKTYTDNSIKSLLGEDVEEAYNTFKDIQDLMKADDTQTADIIKSVSKNTQDIATEATERRGETSRINTAVAELQSTVTSQSTNISLINTNISGINTSISDINESIEANNTRLSQAEETLKTTATKDYVNTQISNVKPKGISNLELIPENSQHILTVTYTDGTSQKIPLPTIGG